MSACGIAVGWPGSPRIGSIASWLAGGPLSGWKAALVGLLQDKRESLPKRGAPAAAAPVAACHLPVPSGSNPCLGSRGGGLGK